MSSEPVQLAKAARELLSQALNALQTNAQVPQDLLEVAEPIAQAMGVLHRVERSNGENLEGRDIALASVRAALEKVQKVTEVHPAVDVVMESVASSLSKVHALVRYTPAAPSAIPAPVVARPAAPAPVAVPAPMAVPAPVAAYPAASAPMAAPAPVAPPAPVAAPPPAAAHPAYPAPPAPPAYRAPSAPPAPPAPPAYRAPSAPPAPPAPPAYRAPSAPPAPPAYVAPPSRPAPPSQPAARPTPPPAASPAPPTPPLGFSPAAGSMPFQPTAQPAQARPAAAGPFRAGQGAPNIDVELGIHSSSNFYKGLGGNDVIEHGGIFVATYKVPGMGTQVNLRVLLPGDYEFQAAAVVQWTREGGGGTEPGFGARFTQITPEGRQLVYRYTRNREPMFYDDL